jgi:MFS family permease
VERRVPNPMVPLAAFASRQFAAANLVCLALYAGLGGVFFLFVVYLQTSLGYSALEAGAAELPVTVLMLALSTSAGALAERLGPRIPLTIGPLVIAVGMLMLAAIERGDTYVASVLPAVSVFGLGLAITVAPVTATALAAVDARHSGAASGINNAVSRAAGLLAVALLPPLAGLTGDDFADPDALTAGFRAAMLITAGLMVAAAVVAWAMIRSDVLAGGEGESDGAPRPAELAKCALDAAPLRPARRARAVSPSASVVRRE